MRRLNKIEQIPWGDYDRFKLVITPRWERPRVQRPIQLLRRRRRRRSDALDRKFDTGICAGFIVRIRMITIASLPLFHCHRLFGYFRQFEDAG